MRSQVILEFLLILAIAIIVGVLYLALGTGLFLDASDRQRTAKLNDVGYEIQDELLLAASVDDGYLRNFTLPQLADRFDYTISNDGTSVTLSSGGLSTTYPLPLLSGSLRKGVNTVRKNGNITVNLP